MIRTTSIRAYEEIRESGLLGKRQKHAYRVLFHKGPLTGQELSREMGIPGQWKRCNELKLRGLAREVGEKICSVTGRNVLLWDVTSNMPKKAKKKRGLAKIDEQIAKYKRTLTRLQKKREALLETEASENQMDFFGPGSSVVEQPTEARQ